MSEQPLYDALIKYKDDKIYPFHMPGHKQGRIHILNEIEEIDVTEIEGTDNLHNPKDCIKEAQNRAAKTFGAEHTFFLVNGSTVGIMSAIATVCDPEDQLIVARNSHRSVYDGMITVGIEPKYIMPEIIEPFKIPGGISIVDIREMLVKYPRAKGVIITSPTYEGVVSDIEKIAEEVHSNNKILIVDEAHGAHFKFNEQFPKTALEQGADIVIQSTHKTLPAYTQSAMLHIQGSRVDPKKIQQRLALYETSSPSYILMSGLDRCRQWLDVHGNNRYKSLAEQLKEIRGKLKKLKNLEIVDERIIGYHSVKDLDISKIVVSCRGLDISGVDIDYILRKKYKIQIELSSHKHFLAITSPADHQNAFMQLQEALVEIDSKLKKKVENDDKYDIIKNEELMINPREAYFKEKKLMSIEDSIDKICGEFVIPYPPGIPIIVPGEKITKEIIEKIIFYNKNNMNIIGMNHKSKEKILIIEV